MSVQKVIKLGKTPVEPSNVEPLLKVLKLLNYSVEEFIVNVSTENPKSVNQYIAGRTGIAIDRIEEIEKDSEGIYYAVKNPTIYDVYRAYRVGLIDHVFFEGKDSYIEFFLKDFRILEIENFGNLDIRIKKLLWKWHNI